MPPLQVELRNMPVELQPLPDFLGKFLKLSVTCGKYELADPQYVQTIAFVPYGVDTHQAAPPHVERFIY
jgi:hypothetical protein